MNSSFLIKSGAALAGQLPHINDHRRATNFRGSEVVGLVGHDPKSAGNGRSRRMFGKEPMFPFRIYQLPSWYRTAPNPAADWLKFCVRAGYITAPTLTLVTTGTDGEPYGYDGTFAVSAGAGVNEWTLTSSSHLFYFYYDPSSGAVESMVDAGSGFTAGGIIIGIVDTSNATGRIPRIRQIQYGDILGSVYCT